MKSNDKSETNKDQMHFYGYDYLRIFAMLGVLLVHLAQNIDVPNGLDCLFSWGANGVYIFFVLSGFLSVKSVKSAHDTKEYYFKRAVRILPSYYFGIVLMIIITTITTGTVYTDIFHLGWLRYFLGLNTVLPSDNYYIWNNRYGYWTMSCFIWFYIFAPLILKYITSLKKAILLLPASVALHAVWKIMMNLIFSNIAGIDLLDHISGASPIATLLYFALGIMIYYAIAENKTLLAAVIVVLLGAVGLLINRIGWTWGAATALGLILFSRFSLKTMCDAWNGFIRWLGTQSFYIYLAHMMAFDLSWYIINRFLPENVNYRLLAWGGYPL